MVFCSVFGVMALLITGLKSPALSGQLTVNIAVVFNGSDAHFKSIAREAETLFSSHWRNISTNLENAIVQPSRLGKLNDTSCRLGAGSLCKMKNVLTNAHGAIFVGLDIDSIFLSSVVESSGIPTIGIFHAKGQPTTQESSADFTRVALPSIIYYAHAIREIMSKMDWRSLRLVVSAEFEGKVFADAMSQIAKDEKWKIDIVYWFGTHDATVENDIKDLVAIPSDVFIIHSRDVNNALLFRTIWQFGSVAETVWILTDITEYGISDLHVLPTGTIKISIRTPHPGHDSNLFTNTIYDALVLFQTAFETALAREQGNVIGQDCLGGYGHSNDSQKLAKTALQKINLKGKSSLFLDPSVNNKPQATFDIWNLREELGGSKHWILMGLRTPTGLALDTFEIPNGTFVAPPTLPSKYTVRVAVNEYYPWVQKEESKQDKDGKEYCVGKGHLCYEYINVTENDKTTLCCFGASIDLLLLIIEDLNCEAEVYFTPDGRYGDFDEKTKMWNGIVQEVISGRADLAVDLSMNALREEYLDFVNPFVHLALNIIVKKDLDNEEGIRWNSWLEPFDVRLWVSIIGLVNIILLVIWWIDRRSPTGHYRQLDSGEDGFTLLDSMSYVWGVAFGKDIGAEKTPHSISARCVSTSYAFFALIVVNTYCANLMAFLVQESYELPITGIRDAKLRHPSLTPPNGFKLGVQRDSQEETYFKFHSQKIFRDVYDVNLKVNLVDSFEDGLKKLKNGEIHGLVGDYLSLTQVVNNDPNCSYTLPGPNFFKFGLGLALAKGSPWYDEVNGLVLKHQENGSIHLIEQRWFNQKTCAAQPFNPLNLVHFSGLFMAVVIVISFCLVAVAMEFVILVVLVRYGNRLGGLEKFMKRFVFNVRRGEENQLSMQYSYLLRRQHKQSWDISAAGTRPRELGFENDACNCISDQSNAMDQTGTNWTESNTEHHNSEGTNRTLDIRNGHVNGGIKHHARSSSITPNIVTRL